MNDNRCGTTAGYRAHYTRGEKPCENCKQAQKLNNKILYFKDKEKSVAARKAWKEKNKERHRELQKRWINSHPEKSRRYVNLRRARRLNQIAIPYSEEQVLAKYGSNCHVCLLPIDLAANRRVGWENWQNGLHLDHLIPLAKGGSDTIDNVRPAHGLCNIKKGSNGN